MSDLHSMREIFGEPGDSEYEAARQLGLLMDSTWGNQLQDVRQKVAMKIAAKCHGQNVRDIDVLVMLSLKSPLPVIIPEALEIQLPSIVHVKSLLAAVEVKDHPPQKVRFNANAQVEVLYTDSGWKNASSQSDSQNIAVRKYLATVGITPVPYVTNIIWLRGVPQNSLPKPPHNVIGADATWEHFIRACMSQMNAWYKDGFHLLNAESQVGTVTRVKKLFTENIQPSLLDRRKLDAISREAAEAFLADALPGKKQLILRGRGGTGKTIGLLTFAYDQYIKQNSRTLIITYNIALASDLERLLTILNVRNTADGRTIHVDTVHGFLRSVLFDAGLIDGSEDFFSVYDLKKQELLELLADKEMHLAIRAGTDAGTYDFVCVDEAQDFPEDERDIIHKLFDVVNCVIADGVDQLVRPTILCDWRHTSDARDFTHTVPLRYSLRMQSNLCMFANAFALKMGLSEWRVEPNPQLPGGRIVVSRDPDFLTSKLYAELNRESRAAGNLPVDMLFCVPNSLIEREHDETYCIPCKSFIKSGRRIWDGTRRDVRKIPALENEMHRFVNYESCRGLEGWTTVLYGFDDFFASKLQNSSFQTSEPDSLTLHLKAAEWLMIPLTRCINTLVINLRNRDSVVSRLLEELASELPDFVEICEY